MRCFKFSVLLFNYPCKLASIEMFHNHLCTCTQNSPVCFDNLHHHKHRALYCIRQYLNRQIVKDITREMTKPLCLKFKINFHTNTTDSRFVQSVSLTTFTCKAPHGVLTPPVTAYARKLNTFVDIFAINKPWSL